MPDWTSIFHALRGLGASPWFQLFAGLASIAGLVITFFTFIRAKNVETALRQLQLETKSKSFYGKKIRFALSYFSGLEQSVQAVLDDGAVNTSKIGGFQSLGGQIAVLRRSVGQGYPWFREGPEKKRKENLKQLEKILAAMENTAHQETLLKQEALRFLAQITELTAMMEEEIKDE